MPAKKSVLVFRTGHLGDTVCAIPAFRLIRSQFADADLTLLCDQPHHNFKVPAVEVIRNLGLFDRIMTYTPARGMITAWQLTKTLLTARPKIIFLLPQVREAVKSVGFKKRFFKSCGVLDVRGFQVPSSHHEWHTNEPNRLVHMLNEVGLSGPKPSYDIPRDEQTRASLAQKLQSAGLKTGSPFIVFCGGGKAATQRWPLERYADVLNRLVAATGWEVLGLGTSEEVESYRVQVFPKFSALRLIPAPPTIAELFELFRMARLYVGNDTGPMHVSAAVGCPVVVIMSARNPPGVWDPDVDRRLIIRYRTACEGCFLTECVTEQHRCMNDISVERVLHELIPFIESLPKEQAKTSPCVALPAY